MGGRVAGADPALGVGIGGRFVADCDDGGVGDTGGRDVVGAAGVRGGTGAAPAAEAAGAGAGAPAGAALAPAGLAGTAGAGRAGTPGGTGGMLRGGLGGVRGNAAAEGLRGGTACAGFAAVGVPAALRSVPPGVRASMGGVGSVAGGRDVGIADGTGATAPVDEAASATALGWLPGRIPACGEDARGSTGDTKSSSIAPCSPIAITPPHTEQRARIPACGIFVGSTRKTEPHSAHVTFIASAPRRARRYGVPWAAAVSAGASCRRSTTNTEPGNVFA